MINKMLWATDGSKDSFEALKYAELLAKKLSSPKVMCKDLWRFPLEWGNGNKYGKNNQRRAFEVGITNRERGDAVSRCG
jgi:hypothetical protein